jgi:hypothetical protein
MKSALTGCNLTETDALFEAIRDFWVTISEEELKSVFDSEIERVRWMIAHNGEYYQGEIQPYISSPLVLFLCSCHKYFLITLYYVPGNF